MKIQNLKRTFRYNSVRLDDPNPAFTLIQVRDFFSTVYPEIVSADIEGPEQVGAEQIYTFRKAVGTKGGKTTREMLDDLAALLHVNGLSEGDAEIVKAMQERHANDSLSPVLLAALAGIHHEYCAVEIN